MAECGKRIAKLSALLINQIAAGEVVTRPASVVKELVENAIDAGATHLSIHIEQGGLGLIQVADNGQGIHPDDMTLAITRHATSKLANISDLTGIDSLGFRGEALASIAAVSHLTVISSHDDSGIGRQLTVNGNDASQVLITPVVKSRGTTVSVRDLYFNIPARRSHLKSIATEFAHIEQVVQKIAVSFAHIDIELYHHNKRRFSLSSQKNAMDLTRLEQALGVPLQPVAHDFQLSLQALQSPQQSANQSEQAYITGWLFVPNQPQQTLPKLVYINQRLVTDFAISQAMAKAARQADRDSLGYALFFVLPPEWINVNIHPSKQQVKIQPLTNMLALLNQAVLRQLKPLKPYQQHTVQAAKPLNTDSPAAPYPSFDQWQAWGQTNQTLAQQLADRQNCSTPSSNEQTRLADNPLANNLLANNKAQRANQSLHVSEPQASYQVTCQTDYQSNYQTNYETDGQTNYKSNYQATSQIKADTQRQAHSPQVLTTDNASMLVLWQNALYLLQTESEDAQIGEEKPLLATLQKAQHRLSLDELIDIMLHHNQPKADK